MTITGRAAAAILGAIAVMASGPDLAFAQRRDAPGPSAGAIVTGGAPSLLDSVVRNGWPEPRPAWRARLEQDEIMQLCSRSSNKPGTRAAAAIQRLARGTIVYPADGQLIGDWKRGEAIAQSGYGQRVGDDESRPNGGNCYACHRIDKAEVSHGTLGPDLWNYGRLLDYSDAAVRRVYDKIYNPHSIKPCSSMPRFGAGRTLTSDQIKDLVALLMSRDSPVNK